MTPDKVKEKLLIVLQAVQSGSGLTCPHLTGSLKPIEDLEGFDSLVWPVAIGMLAAELDINIPDDVNIFASDNGEIPLSIDETTALVCKLAQAPQTALEAAE
jgi:hypothetical protein